MQETFAEKLELLLALNSGKPLTWDGSSRPALQEALIYPEPYADKLRITLAASGNPASSITAAKLGLPITYALIAGNAEDFTEAADAYRTHWAGTEEPEITISAIGFLDSDSQKAREIYYPYWYKMLADRARTRNTALPEQAEFEDYMIMVGSPAEVQEKIEHCTSVLGAQRFSMHMDWSGMPQKPMLNAIELLGGMKF